VKKLLGAALMLSLLAATPAYANHTVVQLTGQVDRGSTEVVAPFGSQELCSNTFCSVGLVMPTNREYGRFVRWCATNPFVVTVPAGATNATGFCFGGGQWVFSLGVGLRDSYGQPTTDSNPVSVSISPFKP
jgi:hypothetical protein